MKLMSINSEFIRDYKIINVELLIVFSLLCFHMKGVQGYIIPIYKKRDSMFIFSVYHPIYILYRHFPL